jgi:cytochrome b561
MSSPARTWSRRHAVLHWLAAALVLVLAALGFVMSDADPSGAARLWMSRAHVGLGWLLLFVTIARLVSRRREHVEPIALSPMHRRMVGLVEGATYVFVLLAFASGVATVVAAGWPAYLAGGVPAPDIEELAPREAHEVFVFSLLGLAIVHVTGVLLHEMRVGGGLARMLPRGANDA